MSIEKGLDGIFKKIKNDIENITIEVGNDIADDSLNECPKDTGALRESQKIRFNGKEINKGSKTTGGISMTPTVTIGYNTDYALRQHEDLTYNHPYPGTKAKYLTDPLNKHAESYDNKIKEVINSVIKNKV